MGKKSTKKGSSYEVNKRASHDYTFLEKFEVGVQLTGTEVKSIKTGGKVNFSDSHVKLVNGELYLINLYIAPYSQGTSKAHEETRTRKLLMHKKEIIKLSHKLQDKGLTIIPVKIYPKAHLIKLEIALSKGKKSFEKREDLKKKTVIRDLNRDFKRSQIKV